LFLRDSVTPPRELEAGRPARTAFLSRVKATATRLGVEILVVVVPAKVRVYPEHLFPNGVLPAARAALYDRILAELAAAGFDVLDVLRPLQAAKAVRPQELLYFRRDTHWAPPGAWLTARLCRQRIQDAGWLPLAGPVQQFGVLAMGRVTVEPDLVGMLGLRPGSALHTSLQEEHQFIGFQLASGEEYRDAHPTAAVALAGTSFSFGGLSRALPHELVRLVDCRGVLAGGGLERGLTETLARIESGELPACKIVVWEIVEHVFAEQW
jgi:alginate O-acetyltransferase complex protein AlgJ